MLTMQNLEACFKAAKECDARYVGVAIQLPNAKSEEIIINGQENFDQKLEYYKHTYNEDLNHRAVPNLKITAFTFGNTFADIEYDLLGNF
jgi:hypothetical protein